MIAPEIGAVIFLTVIVHLFDAFVDRYHQSSLPPRIVTTQRDEGGLARGSVVQCFQQIRYLWVTQLLSCRYTRFLLSSA